MIKLIIFDFDGTIANTKEVVDKSLRDSARIVNINLAPRILHGYEPLKKMFYNFMSEIGGKKINIVYKTFVSKEKSHINEIKLAKNLKLIKELKLKKIILSNNDSSFIREFLRRRKINFFDAVYGPDRFINKLSAMRKIIKGKYKRNEVIYIGDRPADVFLAKTAGVISIAIHLDNSWSSRNELIKAKPDFLISDFKDLSKIIEKQ